MIRTNPECSSTSDCDDYVFNPLVNKGLGSVFNLVDRFYRQVGETTEFRFVWRVKLALGDVF